MGTEETNSLSTPKKRDRQFYIDRLSLEKNAARLLTRHGLTSGDFLTLVGFFAGQRKGLKLNKNDVLIFE